MRISRKQLRHIILTESRRLLTEEKENAVIGFFNTLLTKGLKGLSGVKDITVKSLKHLTSLKKYPKEILKKIDNGVALIKAIIKVLKNMKNAKSGAEINAAIIEAARDLGIAATSIGIDSLMAFFVLGGPAKILVGKLAGVAKKWLAQKIEEVTTFALFKKFISGFSKTVQNVADEMGIKDIKESKKYRRRAPVKITRRQIRRIIREEAKRSLL